MVDPFWGKIGSNEVKRCHKDRIEKMYLTKARGGRIFCNCGKDTGIDKGTCYKMIAKAFTYK